MEKRIITTAASEYDGDIEISLRPDTLETYIGQDKVKYNLKVFIEAAKKRKEPLDHVLLYGPPGPVSYTHLGQHRRRFEGYNRWSI